MDLGEQQMVQRSLLPGFGLTTPGSAPAPGSAHRSDGANGPQTLALPDTAADDAVPHTAPIDGSAATRHGSLQRRGWGEAPTYLEAMSSPAFPPSDLEAGGGGGGVPPPRVAGNLRERTTSTFLGLFNRAIGGGGAGSSTTGVSSWRGAAHSGHSRASSQASLLLQPQTSRLSARSYSNSSDRYGGGAQSPWDSMQSLRISSPLPNSAVRASFEILPRAGLSDQQMRFIASSDALQTVGVSLADPPRRGRRRASSAAASAFLSDGLATPSIEENDAAPEPPTWQSVDEERRRQEAEGRLGLAGPSQAAAASITAAERTDGDSRAASPERRDGAESQDSGATGVTESEDGLTGAGANPVAAAGPPQLPQLNIPSNSAAPAPSLRLQPPTPIVP